MNGEGDTVAFLDIPPAVCPICQLEFDENAKDVVILQKKGAESVNAASKLNNDVLVVMDGTKVHSTCRKDYTRNRSHEKPDDSLAKVVSKRRSRLSSGPFQSQNECLLCGTTVHTRGPYFSSVKTASFVKSCKQSCMCRSDDWALDVIGRIEYCGNDLQAAGCIYHRTCLSNFRSGLEIPTMFQTDIGTKRMRSGRPKCDDQEQAFQRACSFLEEQLIDDQLTVTRLRIEMGTYLTVDSEPPRNQYLKKRLKDRYGDRINFSEQDGLTDIISMKAKTSNILRTEFQSNVVHFDEYTQPHASQSMEEDHTRGIIDAAATIILTDIKSNVPAHQDHYPDKDALQVDSALDYIPDTLKLLLNTMFKGESKDRKVAAIGHAVIQACRPRAVIAPLQLGLGIQVHHLCRSKFLIDTLHEMGFSSSYKEVVDFEKNAAVSMAPSLITDNDIQGGTLLFAGDNVDHNIQTIDGKGTFHGMGIIAALTPGKPRDRRIPRRSTTNSSACISEFSKIPIKEYRFATHARKTIVFEQLAVLGGSERPQDLIWQLSSVFTYDTPQWQGMMQMIHRNDDHPGQSSITFLPMIDLYSGNMSCLLSTLEYVSNLAIKYNTTPVITFDQPLYLKAADIIVCAPSTSHLKNVVLMLGGFHTLMNMLGAIGTLMEGSGLRDIIEEVYGSNTVQHIVTGKAVQRALRAHLLIDKAINNLIVTDISASDPRFASLVVQTELGFHRMSEDNTSFDHVNSTFDWTQIQDTIEEKKEELSSVSKTSKLWMHYQRMLQIVRSLIRADRSGSWASHLQAISECLVVFAAAGHFNYLKSAHMYLQEMLQLKDKHPEVHTRFSKGFYVIRRSNKFWSGISSDLAIEQTLMRSLKTSGGLTHGSGMNEAMRALWIMSRPITSEYNSCMQDFTTVSYQTSDQHRQASKSMVTRDTSDFKKIKDKLISCSPLFPEPQLRNLITGIVSDESVNVHDMDKVGNSIMQGMIGKPVFGISFKRKDKAKTMADASSIKISKEQSIDPALLFQRFIILSKTGDFSLENAMSYELSPHPAALFEARGMMRKADKPSLAHAITEFTLKKDPMTMVETQNEGDTHYVLDGGSLIHRLPWKNGDSFGMIADSYVEFIDRHYGAATVIFDGYDQGPSIKDNAHQRRNQVIHPIVMFTPTTVFVGKKEDFLSRAKNKQKLINLITEKLQLTACSVTNSPGDADVEIAMAAIRASLHKNTTLIGEDTDLLVLLLQHASIFGHALYYRSDKTTSQKAYNIKKMKEVLGDEICNQLLFVHAFTGCDTTSKIFNVGKKSVFRKVIQGDSTIVSCSKAFTVPNQTERILLNSGIAMMAVVCGGKKSDSLESLRMKQFIKKAVQSKTFVTPEKLPPTKTSTQHHSLRVYYQIMVWLGHEASLSPQDYGWRLEDHHLIPIMNNAQPAPDNILQMVHCNCTTVCQSNRCSCRKYGLSCTSACGPCQTNNCENPYNQHTLEQDDVDELS